LSTKKRWAVYTLFFAITCASMVGRIYFVVSDSGLSPFLSANDRSRWLTIRALGDHNTYEIDRVIEAPPSDWRSIDVVQHQGPDGKLHFYSSKPPLLPTLMTYEYLAVKRITGKSIAEDPFTAAQIILVTFNVIPVLIICLLIALMAEKYCQEDWAKVFVVACVCFGTFLTTFAVTLNNHIPAALGVTVAIYALARIWTKDSKSWFLFLLVGLGSAWAVGNELPALSFVAVALVASTIRSIGKTILVTLPGIAVVSAGFFVTNYIAHDHWKPPYAHRNDGKLLAELDPAIESQLDAALSESYLTKLPDEVRAAINEHSQDLGDVLSKNTELLPGRMPTKTDVVKRWVVIDHETDQQLAIVKRQGSDLLELRGWDNWYEYPGSYWLLGQKQGVDRGEPSRANYALHVLIGHHGIFSLTPIWLLTILGIAIGLTRRDQLFWIFVAILLLSVVCVGFYIARPLEDRNYGGVTSTLRWLLWLNPLWLIGLMPAADWLSRNWVGKTVAVLLLIASFASAMYSSLNPWQQPWLYDLMVSYEWIKPFD